MNDSIEAIPVTRQSLLAGKAIVTVYNNTGDHYTFRVVKSKHTIVGGLRVAGPPYISYSVSVLTGPDNGTNYTYVGRLNLNPKSIKDSVLLTWKSKYNDDTPCLKVARWAFYLVLAGQPFPPGYGCVGSRRCFRCGIELTHKDGVANDGYRLGYGPICWKKIQGEYSVL